MTYQLTDDQREICERALSSDQVDAWIETKWNNGGDALVEETIAVFASNHSPKTYEELRAVAYPPVGDQLDALWKQYNTDRLGGKELIQDMDDMLGSILAVKAAHPKG